MEWSWRIYTCIYLYTKHIQCMSYMYSIYICNGTHKYCTKQTTFQWHWSVIQSIIFFCKISWGDPSETPCNRNPKSTPRDLCIHRDRFSHWSDSMHFRDRTRSNRQKHFHRAASNLCLSTTTETLQMCGFPFAYNLHCLCWRRRIIGYSSTSQNAFECLYHCTVACLHSEASLAASASSFEIVSEWIPQWALLENWVPVELVLVWSGFVPLTSLLEKSNFGGIEFWADAYLMLLFSPRKLQHEWREHGRYCWRSPQLPLWEHFPPASGWHVVTPRFGLVNNRGEARQSERL